MLSVHVLQYNFAVCNRPSKLIRRVKNLKKNEVKGKIYSEKLKSESILEEQGHPVLSSILIGQICFLHF